MLCFVLFVCFFNFSWKQSVLIDNFHVTPSLCFMARLSAKPLLCTWFFIVARINSFSRERFCSWPCYRKWEFFEIGNGLSPWVVPIRAPLKVVCISCNWKKKQQEQSFVYNNNRIKVGSLLSSTSFPGFSPTRLTERPLSRSVGRVGENPGNEVVLSSWQRAEFFLKQVYDLRSESERIHHREGGLDIGYQLPLIFLSLSVSTIPISTIKFC